MDEELKQKVSDLENKLDELSNEFSNYKERIDPDNLISPLLDAQSRTQIFKFFKDNLLKGEATWDPGNLVDGAGETSSSITVQGASLGDYVFFSAPYDLQGITANGYVDAANSVKIRIQNETGGAIDLASGTWRVLVLVR